MRFAIPGRFATAICKGMLLSTYSDDEEVSRARAPLHCASFHKHTKHAHTHYMDASGTYSFLSLACLQHSAEPVVAVIECIVGAHAR